MNDFFSRGIYAALTKLGMSPEEIAEHHKRIVNAAKRQGHREPTSAELNEILSPGWEKKYKGSWQEAYLGSDWLKQRNSEVLEAKDRAREEASYQAARDRQKARPSSGAKSSGGASWEDYARRRAQQDYDAAYSAGQQKAKASPGYKAWEDYKAKKQQARDPYTSWKTDHDQWWEETKRKWADQDRRWAEDEAAAAQRRAARQAEYDAARRARQAAQSEFHSSFRGGGGASYHPHSSGPSGLGMALGLGLPLAAVLGAAAYGSSSPDKPKKKKPRA